MMPFTRQWQTTKDIYHIISTIKISAMAFPSDIAERALLDCARCCCLCRRFSSFRMELHHIIQKSDGGEDSFENCIPLCLNCHAEVKAYDPKHPKGRKYTESELRGHRDRWYEKVKSGQVPLVHPDCVDLDRKLFLQIKTILPVEGSIRFIRNHIYASSWLFERHDDLKKYESYCQDPGFEFVDLELEVHRCELTKCIEQFLDIMTKVSFVTDRCSPDHREIAVYPEIKYSKPEIYYEAVDDVEKAAKAICLAYDNLLRIGRRKLAVE